MDDKNKEKDLIRKEIYLENFKFLEKISLMGDIQEYKFFNNASDRREPKYIKEISDLDIENISKFCVWYQRFTMMSSFYELTKKEAIHCINMKIDNQFHRFDISKLEYDDSIKNTADLRKALVRIFFTMEVLDETIKNYFRDSENYMTYDEYENKFVDKSRELYVLYEAFDVPVEMGKGIIITNFIWGMPNLFAKKLYKLWKKSDKEDFFDLIKIARNLNKEKPSLYEGCKVITIKRPRIIEEESEEDKIKKSTCYCCGQKGHIKRDCPKKDSICERCKKKGHLVSVCRWNPTYGRNKDKLISYTKVTRNKVSLEVPLDDNRRDDVERTFQHGKNTLRELNRKKESSKKYYIKEKEKKAKEKSFNRKKQLDDIEGDDDEDKVIEIEDLIYKINHL